MILQIKRNSCAGIFFLVSLVSFYAVIMIYSQVQTGRKVRVRFFFFPFCATIPAPFVQSFLGGERSLTVALASVRGLLAIVKKLLVAF